MSKNHAKKICQKITRKKIKSDKKSVKKIKKCKKLQNLPGLPGNEKSVPPSHIVRIYPRLTSTKSVLRLSSTRLNRAEILKSLPDLLATYLKKEKLSAFDAEFEFSVGLSVGSLRSPPEPENAGFIYFLLHKETFLWSLSKGPW